MEPVHLCIVTINASTILFFTLRTDCFSLSSPEKPKETPQKLTSALDFFGSTPVERESRKVFATKRKQVCKLLLVRIHFDCLLLRCE